MKSPPPSSANASTLALSLLLVMLVSSATAQTKAGGATEPAGSTTYHELVLCRDGSVKGWGSNIQGQLGINPQSVASPTVVPIPGAVDIVRVAVTSGGCSFAIRASGQLLAWGNNVFGQLGIGAGTNVTSVPTVVSLPSAVISVAGGVYSSVALCADGTVWTWGDNRNGGLGDNSPTTLTRYVPAQISTNLLSNIRTIVAGDLGNYALNANGRIFSWGQDYQGSLGIGMVPNANGTQLTPALLNITDVRQVDTANTSAVALRSDGTVWAWGSNGASQLGTGNNNYTSVPAQVGAGTLNDARWVAVNIESGIATRANGSTYVWGFNTGGSLANPNPATATTPIAGPTFTPGVQIIGHHFHFMSLETTGTVKTWGQGTLGYTPAAPGPQDQSYVPTTPTGLCLAVPTASFPVCGPQRAYYQQGSANYRAVLHNCWESPAEIGTVGQLTTIDVSQAPYNGTLTFDGIYHVRGNVRFVNGSVTLTPGTVFYLDGPNGGIISSIDDSQLVSLEVNNATLALNGATLRASCNALWSGIVVGTGGQLVTTAPAGVRSVVRDAQFSVQNVAGTLRLDQADFLNNRIGIYEWPQAASASERITACTFRVGQQGTGGPLEASSNGLYNSVGILFGGDGSAGWPIGNFANAVYSANTFDRLRYGVTGLASNALISGNTFQNCWGSALEGYVSFAAASGTLPALRFYDNTVKVPRNFPAAFTTTANRPVYGVHAQNNVDVRGNTFQLQPPATGAVSRRIGVSLLYGGTVRESATRTTTFDFFDVGIQANGADWYSFVSYDFSRNDFYGLTEGITFRPPGPYNYGNQGINVTMGCNTFDTNASANPATATGVWIKEKTAFSGALGGLNQPNGNRFDGIAAPAKRFVHDAATGGNSFQYFRYGTPQEFFVGGGNTIPGINGGGTAFPQANSPLNACGAGAPTGVNARPASQLLPAAVLQSKQDSLVGSPLPVVRQTALLGVVLGQYRHSQRFAELEGFLRPLVALRPTVYVPGSLLLLNAYRRTGHEADAQRVRLTLNTLASADAELLNYLRYWDAAGHLRADWHLPGGYALPAADLAALRLAAASGTLAARPACELLQRLDTNCRCVLPEELAPAAQTVAAQRAGVVNPASLGEAHPNPATETVSLAYALPANAGIAQLVLTDIFGRAVVSLSLEKPSGLANLAVQALPAGLYLASLCVDGQLLATRKLAVAH